MRNFKMYEFYFNSKPGVFLIFCICSLSPHFSFVIVMRAMLTSRCCKFFLFLQSKAKVWNLSMQISYVSGLNVSLIFFLGKYKLGK